MIIENKEYGKFTLKIDDMSQGDLEKFYKTMREEFGALPQVSSPEYLGATVRTMIKLNWIEPVFDVSTAKPALIMFVAGTMQNHIASLMKISPN